MNGGERYRKQGGETYVVKANNPEILRYFDGQSCETLQELGGGVIVGADDGFVLPPFGKFLDKTHLGGITREEEIAGDGEAVREHRSGGPGFTGLDGGGGEGTRDEGEALGAEFNEVIGEEVAAGKVVDTDKVVVTPLREGTDIAVNQDDGNTRITQTLGDASIGDFVISGVLEGCKEHAADARFDIADAKFFGFLDTHGFIRTRSRAAAPVHPEIIHARKAGEFAADGVEDLDPSESSTMRPSWRTLEEASRFLQR